MESSEKYQPISCVFYDYIEHFAMRKEIVELLVKDGNGERMLKTRILDTKAKDKVEYLLVEATAEWIRMDQIIRINEHKMSDYNLC